MTKKELVNRFKELSAAEADILDEMNDIRRKLLQDETEQEESQTCATSHIIETVPEMLTIQQASERTGMSYSAIRSLCQKNMITHTRVGRKYLVNMNKLTLFLNGN